ncbi:hypothetical protein ACODM8_10090 [Vibrio ostreicida]
MSTGLSENLHAHSLGVEQEAIHIKDSGVYFHRATQVITVW